MAATDTSTDTLKTIGEGLRETRQEVHGLKTFIMGMEDRLTGQISGLRDEMTPRLDRIEAMLEKLISQNGQP